MLMFSKTMQTKLFLKIHDTYFMLYFLLPQKKNALLNIQIFIFQLQLNLMNLELTSHEGHENIQKQQNLSNWQ